VDSAALDINLPHILTPNSYKFDGKQFVAGCWYKMSLPKINNASKLRVVWDATKCLAVNIPRLFGRPLDPEDRAVQFFGSTPELPPPPKKKSKPHIPEEFKLQNLSSNQIKCHERKSIESQITFSTNY